MIIPCIVTLHPLIIDTCYVWYDYSMLNDYTFYCGEHMIQKSKVCPDPVEIFYDYSLQ